MATNGRKPVPTDLKIIRGNPGKRALPDPKIAVKVKAAAPEAPDHLTGPALKEWHRMIDALVEIKLMSKFDMAGLAMYCQAYGHWVEAELSFAECVKNDPNPASRGFTILDAHGIPKVNPLFTATGAASRDVMRYCVEFGMTPSSRSRVTATATADDENPFQSFRKQA